MKRFLFSLAVLISVDSVCEAGVRDRIAIRRAARAEAKGQSPCAQQQQQQPTVIQTVGQAIRNNVVPAPFQFRQFGGCATCKPW